MQQPNANQGRAELRQAGFSHGGLFLAAFLFSIFVNLLMLTGPMFMLQVYDRVLGSGSEETLLALSVLVTFLFAMMGFLDYARGRVMARVGARFQSNLDHRVFGAVVEVSGRHPRGAEIAQTGLRDLEAIQRLFSSPVLMAVFDIPWTPIFLVAIFIFHPWLGILATIGGTVLILLTVLNQWLTSRPVQQANGAMVMAERFAGQVRDEAELVQSLGMRGTVFDRWQVTRNDSLERTISASDRTGAFSTLTKTLRLFLQSAILGLGAYIVLQGEMTAGAMIAASILMGRALAPIEMAIGQWQLVQAATRGWDRLSTLLAEVPPEAPRTALPAPRAILEGQQVTVLPPGQSQAALRVVSFRLEPGQAMGVIGPSGSGKSTLARAITGVWRVAGGHIRLDGATLDQYEPDQLGKYIGYLPQQVNLFDGTIAENIARMSLTPDSEKVVAAAKKAAVHDMIVELPQGYDTPVSATGGRLSGGQVQRIGLARAMYDDPVILVLDEPNSNLDNEGSQALNLAIRQMKAEGKSVMIMAHRPAAIQECETLLVLDGGTTRAYGPRDEVLGKTVQNLKQVRQGMASGATGAT